MSELFVQLYFIGGVAAFAFSIGLIAGWRLCERMGRK